MTDTLIDALRAYVQHKPDCATQRNGRRWDANYKYANRRWWGAWVPDQNATHACTCGLSTLLDQAKGQTQPADGIKTEWCQRHELWWSGPYKCCPVCHMSQWYPEPVKAAHRACRCEPNYGYVCEPCTLEKLKAKYEVPAPHEGSQE